jgi:tRNA uridine 5-carboxymethylaminomethyl modification enzyme
VDEPYRMFTSRAEHRLLLRHDNAAERLAGLGHTLGLISSEQLARVEERRRSVAEYSELLERVQVRSDEASERYLEDLGTAPLEEGQSAAKVLRRPQVTFADLLALVSPSDRERIASAPPEVVEQLDIQARYEGYIRRQTAEITRHRATETLQIPPDFDYKPLGGLTYEAKDKLSRLRPSTLGQASRIPGVSPADISVLLVHVHRSLAVRTESVAESSRAAVGTAKQ